MNHTNLVIPAIISLVLVSSGCNTTGYKDKADAEVYGILAERSPEVEGMTDDVLIENDETYSFEGLPVNSEEFVYLGDEAASEVDSHILSLEEALEIAFNHSRDYQDQKESLYLQALSLTMERHRYDPIFSGSASGNYNWTQSEEFTTSMRDLTGPAASLIEQYSNIVDGAGSTTRGTVSTSEVSLERSVDGRTNIGMDLLLKGGGRLAVDLTSNFLRFLTGDPDESATSALVGVFTQPLLRGAGKDVSAEQLMQAERNLLYQLRSYTRFRKTFSIRIASSYYGVIRDKDTAKNVYLGLESTRTNFEIQEAFLEEGLRTPGQVSRLEEQMLSDESSWTSSINRYQSSLDNFKILIGLPVDSPVLLDDNELTKLTDEGIVPPPVTLNQATEVALVTRLDLYTARDRIEDSQRKIVVAANSFLPQLDLVLIGSVDSKDGNRVISPDWQQSDFTAGFDLELPLDRKDERNNYRRALIDLELLNRSYSLLEDNIKLQVRDHWRNLIQAKTNYEINVLRVGFNASRVEEMELLQEIGEVDILDLIDAQIAYTNSQTGLTNALVQHRIALLEFWRDIGVLYIKSNGQWEDIQDV
jgi:outer membrane protein TolC